MGEIKYIGRSWFSFDNFINLIYVYMEDYIFGGSNTLLYFWSMNKYPPSTNYLLG
jgi:hypothetical protein